MAQPEAQRLGAVEWDFFVTLTFASLTKPRSVYVTSLFAFLREVAERAGVPFEKMLWFVRKEAGEMTGREHYHLLIGGLPPSYVHLRSCFQLRLVWDHEPEALSRKYTGKKLRMGMARVRLYDPNLDGVGYCLKKLGELSGADLYEYSKFSLEPSELTLSRSLIAFMRKVVR